MPYSLAQPVREKTAPYVFFKELFTKEECKKIISISKHMIPQEARVGNGDEGAVNTAQRRTELFWINWETQYDWIFAKMALPIAQANQAWWGYHLAGLNEALQLTHYKSKDKGFYDWHEDHSDAGMFAHRKLSCVILLNEGFTGGKFELWGKGTPAELTIGSMIIFPSYKLHRVTPVTKGQRWSLVSWVSGPPFV